MNLADIWKLTPLGVVEKVRRTYGLGADLGNASSSVHRKRRNAIATRLRLYRDDAHVDFYQVINRVFKDRKVRGDRYDMVELAEHRNITRGIVDEISSLYDRPALRSMPSESATNSYRGICKLLDVDDIMQEGLRLTTLCNDVLVWSTVNSAGKPSLRLITPDLFDAIPLPDDATAIAALLFDRAPDSPDNAKAICFELWDAEFRYLLNRDGRLVDEFGNFATHPVPHGQRGLPGFIMHRRKPMEFLLDARHGADITSAHLAVFLIDCMILRLAKSQGERQPILTGDMANVATRQSLDGETPLALPPGVIATMLDSKTSPEHYIQVKSDIIAGIEAAYGVDYGDRNDQSGTSFIARRSKLVELREEHRRRSLMHERELCDLLGFDGNSLAVDYREQAVAVSATDEVALLRDKVKMGLDSPIDFLMRKNPDLTRAEAFASFERNIEEYATYIKMIRALNAPDLSGDIPIDGTNVDGQATIAAAPASTPTAPVVEIAKTALNGAQISSLLEILRSYVDGGVSRDSAIALLALAFQMGSDEASRILGPVNFSPSDGASQSASSAP